MGHVVKVTLGDEAFEALRVLAFERKVSLPSLVRLAVERVVVERPGVSVDRAVMPSAAGFRVGEDTEILMDDEGAVVGLRNPDGVVAPEPRVVRGRPAHRCVPMGNGPVTVCACGNIRINGIWKKPA